MDLPDELENKAGPFPVWVWGAAIGVIVIGVWWYRNNSSGAAAATTGTGTMYDPTALDNAALYSGNNSNASNASNATASTAKVARTNVAWMRQCMVYETGKGRNALTVQRALSRYLMSKPLSDRQHDIVSDALTHIGLPPKPPKLVSPVKHPHDGGNGNPHTPPGGRLAPDPGEGEGVLSTAPEHDTSTEPHMARTSVSGFHLYDTSPGDTPASVAHAVYGTSAPYYVERVRSANGVGSTDEFPGGIRVKVPYMPTTSAVPQGRRRPSSV